MMFPEQAIYEMTSKYRDYFYDKTMIRFRELPLGVDVEAILPNLRE
jgi:hypothetical protein